ncbi:glutathione transferase GstA [Zoogloea sp.]|jgi:glutathione S-transferase|uniref:glutathione transferase GstA n=1 Tax=Zoogloea sp. TaxID=49181 RepID=UPI00260BC027|nr:glutathione transferase GstA [Zoogloea sp.]
MKLYYSPGACSLSPHIVLREAGFDITLEKVNLRTKEMESGGDFLAINPKGYVPALELDGGEILTEGPAIIQYVADLVPEKKLVPPAGTLARARVQEWLNFIGTELHKSFSPLFNPATSDDAKAAARALIDRRLAFAASVLDAQPYLTGDSFTVADAYLFTVLSWTGYVKVDITPWPSLGAYFERVKARPAVQAAMAAEGLTG